MAERAEGGGRDKGKIEEPSPLYMKEDSITQPQQKWHCFFNKGLSQGSYWAMYIVL